MADEIHMKWNDFEENIREAFKDFRNVLSDVVIHGSNGKTYANRLVLCACSDVFRSMLMDLSEQTQQQTAAIILWETDISHLNLIIDFMYCGEVKVTEPSLPNFLALAERLKVKGLCRKEENDISESSSYTYSKVKQKRSNTDADVLGEITENEGGRGPAKKSRPGPPDSVKIKNRAEDDDIIELEPEQELVEGQENLYPVGLEGQASEDHLTSIESLDQMMEPFQTPFPDFGCTTEEPTNVDYNIDLNTSGISDPNNPYVCNLCMKSYKSQGSLQNHRSIYHRDQIKTRRSHVS